jgi:hypothetical protein
MEASYVRYTIFASVWCVLAAAWIGVVPCADAAQSFKDEAGRLIYSVDDNGTVSMFENSPGIDITLSVTRGTRDQMQPQVNEVVPDVVAAGTSTMLKLRGKNLVGATVKFSRPGIETGPFAGKPTVVEVPIRVAPNAEPGDIAITVTTPIGSTQASMKITDLKLGGGATRREDRSRTTIATTAPASCPDGMIGVAAESGGFCIDIDETFTADFLGAEKACAMKGKRLCQASEWQRACEEANRNGLPLKNMIGNWEWTGSWNTSLRDAFDTEMTSAVLKGKNDCEAPMNFPQGKRDPLPGRCCK